MTTALKRHELTEYQEFVYGVLGFEPHDEQIPIITCRKRFIVVSGGEQGGKSLVSEKHLVGRLDEYKDPYGQALYWLVAADYERTRAEFDYLMEDFEKMGVLAGHSKNVDPGYIEAFKENGRSKAKVRIETKSATDSRKLAMKAPDGIIICEASQVDFTTFNKARFRVGPNRGWLLLSGTLEGSLGWYPKIIQDWKYGDADKASFELPTWTNIHKYPGGRNDPEILAMERDSSDDFFMERIAGKPVPPRGLVFPEFRADVHVSDEAEYVPGEPVYLWVDPGYAHAHAVLAAQIVNGRVQIFDEIYEHMITQDVINLVKTKPWAKDIRYGVIDVGGTQHQAMSSPAELWQSPPTADGNGGIGLYMAYQKVGISEGVERVKSFLKLNEFNQPRLIVNPKCEGLLSEFGIIPHPLPGPGFGETRAYRWKMDKEQNIVGDVPDDKNNDAIKAMTYGLWERYGPVRMTMASETIKVKRWR